MWNIFLGVHVKLLKYIPPLALAFSAAVSYVEAEFCTIISIQSVNSGSSKCKHGAVTGIPSVSRYLLGE